MNPGILHDHIKAFIGFEALGSRTDKSPKSGMRMVGPKGDPQARNLFEIIAHLQKREGHAVATLAEQIEAGKFTTGMVTALGWFMHKQAVGVYGSSPHGRDIGNDYRHDQADPLAGEEPVPFRDAFNGTGIIDTYTVIYAPDQAPSYGVIYGKTPDQERFVARIRDHSDLFAWLMEKNRMGQPVRVRSDGSAGVNLTGL
ncbi:MAG: hypothetical protein R6U38_04425 [Desulfatiglandaceae bacterium]